MNIAFIDSWSKFTTNTPINKDPMSDKKIDTVIIQLAILLD